MDSQFEASQLQALLESAKLLAGSSLDLDGLLRHLLRTVMGRLLVTRAVIAIRDGSQMTVALARGVPQIDKGSKFESTRAAELGLPILFAIGDPAEPLGMLALSQPARGPMAESERDFLQALLGIAASIVQNAAAHDEVLKSNRVLDQRIQELRALLDLVRGFASTVDPEQVAQLLMLTLAGRWAVRKHAIVTWKSGQPPIERIKGLEIPDSSRLKDLADPWVPGDTVGLSAGSVVFPIRSGDSTTGAAICGPRPAGLTYAENDLEFGSGLVAQASVALDNAWHFRDTLYRQQLERELTVASSIQKDLFPKQMPRMAYTEMSGRNRQAREIGGDYYDVLPVGESGAECPSLFCVCDISGKGISASLLMANIQATLRALLFTQPPMQKLVAQVNELLYASTPSNKYATGFFLLYNPQTGECEYVNGGHNEAIILRADGSVEMLGATGMPIGLLPHREFDSAAAQLNAGDLALLYSDGVPEAWNLAEEEFGNDRIIDCLRETANLPPEEILDHLITRIDEFAAGAPQHDDITLLVLKRRASP